MNALSVKDLEVERAEVLCEIQRLQGAHDVSALPRFPNGPFSSKALPHSTGMLLR